MAVDYELSTMQSRKQFFAEDEKTEGRITLPGEGEFTVRVNKVTLIGVFTSFLLILVGLAVNTYFVLRLKPIQNHENITGEVSHESGVEYCLGVVKSHLSNSDGSRNIVQVYGQDMDTFLRKVDKVDEKVDDLKGNLDIFEKKLDGMIIQIQNKDENLPDMKEGCDDTNQTRKLIFDLSDQLTSLASTIENIKHYHERATRKVELIQDDVNSLRTFVLGTLTETLLEFNKSIESNEKTIANSSRRLLEVYQRRYSDERNENGQLLEWVKNNTDKLYLLSKDIYAVSDKLSDVDNEVNKTNFALSEMSDFLMGHFQNMMNKTLTEVKNNGNLEQINADATNLFQIRTEEALEFLASDIQKLGTESLLNLTHYIANQLTVSSLDIKNIQSQNREVEENLNEASLLQRSILEKSESMNRSIGSMQAQSLMTGDMMMSFIQNSDDFNRGLLKIVNDSKANVTQVLRLVEQEILEAITLSTNRVATSLLRIQTEIGNGSKSFGKEGGEIGEFLNTVNSSFTTIEEIREILHGLSSAMTRNSSGQLPRPVNELSDMKSVLENILSSITINSNKLENSNLSTAVIKLLDETSTIHEALMSSSNQTLSCRSDGCFFKTIPVGLPPSSNVVQKDAVRLANAQIGTGSIRGRLEVYRSGSWGTVCDDSFSNTDATVACRMMGYSTGVQKQSAFFGAGSGTIHMDDVRCSGRENSIFSCRFTSSHNCGHGEDVGVICS